MSGLRQGAGGRFAKVRVEFDRSTQDWVRLQLWFYLPLPRYHDGFISHVCRGFDLMSVKAVSDSDRVYARQLNRRRRVS